MTRLRTLDEALAEIRAEDPNTAVSRNLIRRLIITNAVPTIHAGKKRLVNLDALLAYLEGNTNPSQTEEETGIVRRITGV